MPSNVLLLSIHPEFASKIFNGSKKVELRKIKPRLTKNDIILIYETSPVSALSGAIKVKEIISDHPNVLWKKIKLNAGISWEKFSQYYEGKSKGFAILIKDVFIFPNVIELCNLKKIMPAFHPPQSYIYLENDTIISNILKTSNLDIQ